MAEGQCAGRRRRHTKKHKRHSRRRLRGGTTEASFAGVETLPGGHLDVRVGSNMSGTDFTTPGYGGGRRRRSRKTRRRYRRSMRGGTGGEGVGYGFGGPLTDGGIGAAQRAYVDAPTSNHTGGSS